MTTDPITTAGPAQRSDHMSLLTSLAGVGMLLALFIFLYVRVAFPGDGAPVVLDTVPATSQGLVVRPITPRLDGLKSGDVVSGVQDHSVDELLSANFTSLTSPLASGSESYVYTALRESMLRGVRVRIAAYPIAQAISDDWAVYLFLVFTAALGTFVFMRRPDLPAARVFFRIWLTFLVGTVIYLMGFQVSDSLYGWFIPFSLVVETILFFYGMSSILHFVVDFPRRLPLLRRHPALWFWIYAGPLLVYALLMLWLAPSATSAPSLLQIHSQAIDLVGGLFAIHFVVGFVLSFRSTQSASERRQMRWIMWGGVIGVFPWLLMAILSPLTGISQNAALPILGISFLAIPTTLAIAILREQLFDIDLIINRTLVYAPLTAILAGVYSAIAVFSQHAFVEMTGQSSDAGVAIAALLVVALFTPLKDALQNAVDRRLKGQHVATQRLLDFGEHVQMRLAAVEPDQLARRFLQEAALAFRAECGAVYLEENGQLRWVSAIGEWRDETELSVPLETGKPVKQLGIVRLGKRERDRDYTTHDARALREVAGKVAEAIDQDRA